MEIVPGSSGTPGDTANTVSTTWCGRSPRCPARICGTRGPRSTRTTSRPSASRSIPTADAVSAPSPAENIGRQLAIVLDGRVQSAPRIEGRITTDGRITGSFTTEEVNNLSLILRSGALPASLTYIEERTIGPSLGADSIRSGVTASVVGLLLVISFMLVYYKLSGVNCRRRADIEPDHPARADGVHRRRDDASGHRRLRAHDGHRRRLERADLRAHQGRARGAARRSGVHQRRLQSRVLDAVDTHIAALISCAFLFQFGTGPIRGFAVTLVIGLISNLFTSIFVSKTLFELALDRRHQVATLSI